MGLLKYFGLRTKQVSVKAPGLQVDLEPIPSKSDSPGLSGSAPGPSNDGLGIKFSGMRFYEYDDGAEPPMGVGRDYKSHFSAQNTWNIVAHVNYDNLMCGHGNQTFRASSECHGPDGQLIFARSQELFVASHHAELATDITMSPDRRGAWPQGTYTFRWYINGVLFGEECFWAG